MRYKSLAIIIILISLVACKDSLIVEQEIDADYLVSSKTFQLFISDHEAFMMPVIKNINRLGYNEVMELEDKLLRKFEELGEFKKLSLENNAHLINIVELLGYDNIKQYEKLFEDMQSSLTELLETYPDLDKFYESGPDSEMKKAMDRLISKRTNFDDYVINKRYNNQIAEGRVFLAEGNSCEDEDGLSECLDEAQSDFYWSTAGCIAGGAVGALFSVIAGVAGASACQAVNILHYEDKKQKCITGSC